MQMKLIIALVAMVAAGSAAAESELDEVLKKAPAAIYSTTNSLGSLEYCFGLVLANYGVPFVLHGEKETLMGSERTNIYLYTIQIRPVAGASQVIVRSKDRNGYPTIKRMVEACLVQPT